MAILIKKILYVILFYFILIKWIIRYLEGGADAHYLLLVTLFNFDL